jgi:hypothetical protein
VKRATATCSGRSRDGFEALAGLAGVANDFLVSFSERSITAAGRVSTLGKVARLMFLNPRGVCVDYLAQYFLKLSTARALAIDANQFSR